MSVKNASMEIETKKSSVKEKMHTLHELLSSNKQELSDLKTDISHNQTIGKEEMIRYFGENISHKELRNIIQYNAGAKETSYLGSFGDNITKYGITRDKRREIKRLSRDINQELDEIKELDPQFSLNMETGKANIEVQPPENVREARKLAKRLEKKRKNLERKKRELAKATGNATAIALIQDEIDWQTETITKLHTGDYANLIGYERDPDLESFVNTYCGHKEGVSSKYQQKNTVVCPPVEGLLKNVDTMDDGQKRRLGKMAKVAGYALTAWALYQALFGKDKKKKGRAYGILGVNALALVGSYVGDNGKLMGLGGMLEGVMIGGGNGRTIDKFMEMFGVDANLANSLTQDAVEGTEVPNISAALVASIIPDGMTHKEFNKFIDVDHQENVTLKVDQDGNSLLGAYWYSKGDQKKAEMANSYAKAGNKQFEQGLVFMGIKDDILAQENTIIDKTKIATTNKKVSDYTTKNNLDIADTEAIHRYYAGEITRNELLNQPGVFESKESVSVTTDLTRYDVEYFDDIKNMDQKYSSLMQIDMSILSKHTITNGTQTTIDWVKLSNETTNPTLKKYIKGSTNETKQQWTHAISGLLHATGTDISSMSTHTGTLQDLLTNAKPGLTNLSYAYTLLNDQNLKVTTHERRNFHTSVYSAPTTTSIDILIADMIADNTIVFDTESNPLLKNIDSSDIISKLPNRSASPLSLQQKMEYIARELYLNEKLSDKLPIPMTLTPAPDGSVSMMSYGQQTQIQTINPKGTTLIHQAISYDGKTSGTVSSLPIKPTTIAEAMNIAQLTNFTTGIMRYGGKSVAPRSFDNGELEFAQQDSFLERGKDVRSSGFSRETIKGYIDKDVLSQKAIETNYPLLSKGNYGESYTQWLNKLTTSNGQSLWHKKHDPEVLDSKIAEVKGTIATINSGYGTLRDKFYINDMETQGNIVKIRRHNTNEYITLDVMDNQVLAGMSPLIVPGSLESATRLAAHLLLAKEYMLHLYDEAYTMGADAIAALKKWAATNPLFQGIINMIENLQALGSNLIGIAGHIVSALASLTGITATILGSMNLSKGAGGTGNGKGAGGTGNGKGAGGTGNGKGAAN